MCAFLCVLLERKRAERASERGIHFAAAARMQIYPHQNLLTRNFASGKERKKEKAAAAGKRKDSKMRRGEREGASTHTHTCSSYVEMEIDTAPVTAFAFL